MEIVEPRRAVITDMQEKYKGSELLISFPETETLLQSNHHYFAVKLHDK